MAETVSVANKTIDVQRAFIEGIRTVLIVDDRMRSYDQVATPPREFEPAPPGSAEDVSFFRAGAPPPQWDIRDDMYEDDTASALVKDFRERGWLHDVLNDGFDSLGVSRAQSCDLVILDYRLGDEGERSLKILHGLAGSARLHLVVVYTADNEEDAWFSIAATLAPKPSMVSDISDDEQETLRARELERREVPSSQDVVDYLCGKISVPARKTAASATKKGSAVAPEDRVAPLHACKWALREHERRDAMRKKLGIFPGAHFEASSGALKWLRCDNLFVVIEHKRPSETLDRSADRTFGAPGSGPLGGKALVDKLAEALQEWSPSFFRRMLRFIRHRVASEGLMADAKILKGPIGEAALLMYAQGGGPEEQSERRRQIYSYIFESVLDGLLTREDVRCPEDVMSPDDDPFKHAANAAKLIPHQHDNNRQKILVRLNWFLSFDEQIPPYLRTGMIFLLPDKKDEVGICVTPECDLVPGRRDAAQPVLWRRAALVRENDGNWKKEIKEALQKATSGHYLFAIWETDSGIDEEVLIKLRPGKPTDIPKPKALFVLDDGRVRERCFRAVRASADGNGIPRIEPDPQCFQVVGQLRAQLATRLLHETGHELSRVGLDFESLPKD